MAKLLCVTGKTIASRYWSEHCPQKKTRKPVIIGLFFRDSNFILVFSLFNMWSSFLFEKVIKLLYRLIVEIRTSTIGEKVV